jgi:hypothetical protein
MKKIILAAFFAVFALNALPFPQKEAAAVNYSCAANRELTRDEVKNLEARLYEIREMAAKGLSKDEKAVLRKEVQGIKESFSQPLGGGIYISAGALILIIILLIILL